MIVFDITSKTIAAEATSPRVVNSQMKRTTSPVKCSDSPTTRRRNHCRYMFLILLSILTLNALAQYIPFD